MKVSNRSRNFAFSFSLSVLSMSVSAVAVSAAESAWLKHCEGAQHDVDNEDLPGAELNFRQAVAESNGAPIDDRVRCIDGLASVLKLQNKTTESESLYLKALNMTEAKYGQNSDHLVHDLMQLGSMYESAGDHSVAMKYYARVIAINEHNYASVSPQFASDLNPSSLRKVETSGESSPVSRDLVESANLAASMRLMSQQSDYKLDFMKRSNIDSQKDLLSDFRSALSHMDSADELASGKFQNSGLKPEAAKNHEKFE